MIRDEIEWIIRSDLWFTTIFIWDNKYAPYQCSIFRRNNGSSCYIKAYFGIEDKIYIKMFDIAHDINISEDELLFHITRTLRDELNYNIDKWLDKHYQKKIKDSESSTEEDVIISKIFFDAHTISLYKGESPDFGFYSLSPNFHILKKLEKEGETPTIDEEFERLLKKYKR